jgi:hypothetical protein
VHDGSVAAFGAAELARYLGPGDLEVHKSGVVDLPVRRQRRLLDRNPHVLHRLFVLG